MLKLHDGAFLSVSACCLFSCTVKNVIPRQPVAFITAQCGLLCGSFASNGCVLCWEAASRQATSAVDLQIARRPANSTPALKPCLHDIIVFSAL